MQNPFFGFPENGFFCGSQVDSSKKMQNRRISVSSPYSRTAETDFGERKSEYDKNQREAVRLPFLNFELILLKSLNINKCLYPIKTFPFSLFRSALFCGSQVGSSKKMQNRRISVSSPYNRTAETDFGERKSEYGKTQEIRERISCLP